MTGLYSLPDQLYSHVIARMSVTLLKDIIHLYLLQQSEYLRRVTLGISLIQSKHIESMADSVGTAVVKLADILEYQEALRVTTDISDKKVIIIPGK